MAAGRRPPFMRRRYLVKGRLQGGFALIPMLLLALSLLGTVSYLVFALRGALELHLHLAHSRLQNPWQEMAPVVIRAVWWGGGAFLAALSLWAWAWFGGLRRDLDRLADWVAVLPRDPFRRLPTLSHRDVGLLGERLREAGVVFGTWQRRVRTAAEALDDALERARREARRDQRAHESGLGSVRRATDALVAVAEEVAVHESVQ